MFRRALLTRAPSVASAEALGVSSAAATRLAAIVQAAKDREGLAREAQLVYRCNSEISKLLKLAEVKAILGTALTPKRPLTSAELIHLTAFSPSAMVHGRNDEHIHEAGCPVANGETSMATMTSTADSGKVACQHCLRRRLNFLASDHFAHSLHWNSIMPTPNATNHISNQKVYQLVRESFGSMRAMEDTLAEFAVNRRDGGFTWLVYNPNAPNVRQGNNSDGTPKGTTMGKLEAINLPGSTSPVVLGMWPVLNINLTTDTIVDTLGAASTPSAAEVAHSWSRQARNPDSVAARPQVGNKASDMTLADLRRVAATQQAKSLDIAFMEGQVQKAIDYFASEEYQQAAAARKEALTQQAHGKVVKSFENVELDAVNVLKKASAAAVAAEKEKNAAAEAASKKAAKTATSSAAAAASTAAAAPTASTSASVAEPAATEGATGDAAAAEAVVEAPAEDVITAEGVCDDGVTRYTTRSSGITSYAYANGTSTDVYPDGRRVDFTAELTTTSYPDGTIHYLYANGATVEFRPDGTKYVNGELSTQ